MITDVTRTVAIAGANLVLAFQLHAQAALPGKAGITYELFNANPRVGESTSIAAKLVGPGGVQQPNSRCSLDLATDYVRVTPEGSITALRKTPPGGTTLTIRCHDAAGTQSTLQVPMTVRGRLYQLQLNRLGTGNGSVMAFPPNGLGYEEGTQVQVSAKPTGKSVLKVPAFSGDCDAHSGVIREMTRDMQCSAHFYASREERTRAEAQQAARGTGSGTPSYPAGGGSGGPRAGGGGAGKAVAVTALLGGAGVGAYFFGKYLASQSALQPSGSSSARVSTRTCTISAFTGACSCVGSTDVPAPAGIPTPAPSGGACVSNACQAGLSCNNGRCEGSNGRCPF